MQEFWELIKVSVLLQIFGCLTIVVLTISTVAAFKVHPAWRKVARIAGLVFVLALAWFVVAWNGMAH